MALARLAVFFVTGSLLVTHAHAGNARRTATRVMAADAKSRPGQDTAWPTSSTTQIARSGRPAFTVWDSGRFLGRVTTLHYDPVTGEDVAATHRSFQIRMHREGKLVLVTPPRLLRTEYSGDRVAREYTINDRLLRE